MSIFGSLSEEQESILDEKVEKIKSGEIGLKEALESFGIALTDYESRYGSIPVNSETAVSMLIISVLDFCAEEEKSYPVPNGGILSAGMFPW